jgi:glycosyltransferase involved in cell wall biosynthesis
MAERVDPGAIANERKSLPVVTVISPFPNLLAAASGTTGLTWYTKSLVEKLVEQGQKVEVWANDESAETQSETTAQETMQSPNLQLIRNWHRGFFGVLRLVKEILKRRPRFIHIQQEFNMFGGATALVAVPLIPLAARIVGAKLITTMHGGFGKKDLTPEYVAENGIVAPVWVIKCIFNYVFGAFARLSHHVIVHEAWQKEQLIEEYGMRRASISVIPIGVPQNRETITQKEARKILNIPEAAKVYLFMGYAAKYKGLPQLLDAAELLFGRDPNALVIVGAGMAPRFKYDKSYLKWYDELANRAQSLAPRLRWVGFISNDQVGLYYSSADTCVFPYSRRIAASGPLAIALSFGRAIALSDGLKGLPSSGFTFESDDSELLEKSKLNWDQTTRLTVCSYEGL